MLQVENPGFPTGRRKTINWSNFPHNCVKMKNLSQEGRMRSKFIIKCRFVTKLCSSNWTAIIINRYDRYFEIDQFENIYILFFEMVWTEPCKGVLTAPTFYSK